MNDFAPFQKKKKKNFRFRSDRLLFLKQVFRLETLISFIKNLIWEKTERHSLLRPNKERSKKYSEYAFEDLLHNNIKTADCTIEKQRRRREAG